MFSSTVLMCSMKASTSSVRILINVSSTNLCQWLGAVLMKKIKALLSTSSIYRLVTMGDTGEPMGLEIGGHEAEVQLCTHRVQSEVRPGR